VIVYEINIWIFPQGPDNAIADTTVRQDFRGIGRQNRVADIRVPHFDIFNRQVIWKMPWA